MRSILIIAVAAAALLSTVTAQADLTMSAPPREGAGQAADDYTPLADYLAKLLGEKVNFRYADNWLTYQTEMQKGRYDIAFDGPHFVSWRIAKLNHTPIVKLPGALSFVVVVKKDQAGINSLKDLAGRAVCAHAPPNLSTLVTQYEFDNPVRQPHLVEIQGFKMAYDGMMSGKCVAAVLQTKLWEDYDKGGTVTKAVFKSKPLPNQALTLGPRIPADKRQKIAEALLNSAEGKAATQKMRDRFKGQDFVAAKPEEYQYINILLKDVWGFGS